jgi:hypothetical protein
MDLSNMQQKCPQEARHTYVQKRIFYIIIKKLGGLVRERTIPTERPPPLVVEVSANFYG